MISGTEPGSKLSTDYARLLMSKGRTYRCSSLTHAWETLADWSAVSGLAIRGTHPSSLNLRALMPLSTLSDGERQHR